ncbi:MAG: hypothetical protein HRU28_16905 [Rhizobiales bacterium]|nr:hypothetical protein [Hyphomicrobiales bacterium]
MWQKFRSFDQSMESLIPIKNNFLQSYYEKFHNNFINLFLFVFTFFIVSLIFTNAIRAEESYKFGTIKLKSIINKSDKGKTPPLTADEIEALKSKAAHDMMRHLHAVTYSFDQFLRGMKLGCYPSSIIDGLRDYDSVINKWFKDDDASIKFDNSLSSYNPDKILRPDTNYKFPKIQSIAKIQFLPDFYLTSTSTVEECKKNGCEVHLRQLSPFSVGSWLSIWVDENSFVELNYIDDGIFRYSLERLNKFKDKDYSYSIVIQGAKNPKNFINQMSFYIRASDLDGIECTKNCDQLPTYNGANKSKYKPWLPLYSISAFYSDHVKKSCDY